MNDTEEISPEIFTNITSVQPVNKIDEDDFLKLESELQDLTQKETKLQHHLDSLEEFLFKEKQFVWNQGKKKVFFDESLASNTNSATEFMATTTGRKSSSIHITNNLSK